MRGVEGGTARSVATGVGHNATMSRAVYLHVGAPRTGSSYLHRRLAANRESLVAHGVQVPAPDGQAAAAHDLVGRRLGSTDVSGRWDQLVRATARVDGTAVISHDILAGARSEEAMRALGSFRNADLHVVFVVRDLARQLPAEWQESLKRGRSWTYARFLDRMVARKGATARTFWRSQDISDVLRRWTAGLEPDHVHVIVAPAGEPTNEQRWELYCSALGIDPSWAPIDVAEVPGPLSITEAGALRAVNQRLQQVEHDAMTRRQLIRETLDTRHVSPGAGGGPDDRITLRPDLLAWAAGITEEWVDWLTGSGVHVVGRVEDLWSPIPDPDVEWADPDEPDPAAVATTALDLLATMTVQATRRVPPNPPTALARAARLLRGAG